MSHMILACQPDEFPRARIHLCQEWCPGKFCSGPAAKFREQWAHPRAIDTRGCAAAALDRLCYAMLCEFAPLSVTVAFSSSAQARTQAVWHDSCNGLNFSLMPVHLTFVLPLGKDWNASTSISDPSKIIWRHNGQPIVSTRGAREARGTRRQQVGSYRLRY